jgi:hypothetical protein
MQQIVRLLVLAAALALAAGAWAQTDAGARFALVVGNASYHRGALPTPSGDAKAMAEALRGLGFQVVELIDGGKAEMESAVMQAAEAMRGGRSIGLFFYAGHALQFGHRNYLVPVDARLAGPTDVLAQTVDVQSVVEAFERAGNRNNVFVFDASRDHPFSASASGRGLAQMDAPPGSFLAFAASPGEVADEARTAGGTSLYTHHLLAELALPGAKIEDLFKRVRYQVRKHSQGRQLPWESTSLEHDFHFDLPATAAGPLAPARPPQAEALHVRPQTFRSEFVADGTRFIGNFQADASGRSYSGTGRVIWADGSSFDGTLVQGLRDGLGHYAWANGQRYEGEWRDDRPSGAGRLWFANGDVYEGLVEDGHPNGQGRMRFAGGDRYVGEFKAGIADGRGAYTWANGQTLVGRWVAGRVEGDATLRFVNGNVYEGGVAQGRPEGPGRMAFRSGDVYAGEFKAGRPDGEGVYSWPNGDRFVGRWVDGRREGLGVMTWRNGDRWEGRYRADEQGEGQWIAAAK